MTQSHCSLEVRFFQPPPELRRYFTTFYHVRYESAGQDPIEDILHPEWGNLRFVCDDAISTTLPGGGQLAGLTFCATGPSTRAVPFSLGGKGRLWGVGLLPLGWAKFVAEDAAALANAVLDGNRHPAFDWFRPLAAGLFGTEPDLDTEVARISAHFLTKLKEPARDGKRIVAIHEALIDPEVHSVAQLVERSDCSLRTVERVCNRAFGFSPKLLLRRQRFLRSLAQYMLDPSLRWIGALDRQYHDQAQFVRDFKAFMGLTPRKYAALDKPVIGAMVRERARFAGRAMQGLDTPEGGSA